VPSGTSITTISSSHPSSSFSFSSFKEGSSKEWGRGSAPERLGLFLLLVRAKSKEQKRGGVKNEK
jgi:hypothetical protein